MENDAPYRTVLEVPEEEQTTVFVMGVERDARLRVVERALRAAPSFAKHMGEVSVAYGANLGQILVMGPLLVTVLLEERRAYVLHTLH